MAELAVSRDDPRYINGLRCAAMDARQQTLGQRLVAAVQTLASDELVRRSHCPAWITLAVREFLLRWDSSGIRILRVI